MPEFAPGESKTAVAPVTVKPAGLSCEAEIFLGPDELTKVVTSGRMPFTSTSYSQEVRLPIAMPAAEGSYHAYIDVYAEGILIAAYTATEDVVIMPIVPAAVEITSITLDKTKILGGEDFTISITFSNPHDYDVWVRPQFAFGKLDTEFSAEAILCGWESTAYDGGYVGPKTSWIDLGGYSTDILPEAYGENMTPYLYDPDGAALTSGEHAYLKVPAKGQATTSLKWYISGAITYGTRDVCVKVEDAFNLIYYPEGTYIIRYGLPEAIGKLDHYKKVNYAYAPFSGVVSDIVTIGTPPGAVTIDSYKLRVSGGFYHEITITNNTGKTLVNQPGKQIYTWLFIRPYTAETFQRLRHQGYDYWIYDPDFGSPPDYRRHIYHERTYKTLNPGDAIMGNIFACKGGTFAGAGFRSVPPGTTTYSLYLGYGQSGITPSVTYVSSENISRVLPLSQALPDGLKGYVIIHFSQVDQRGLTYIYGADVYEVFKGSFSSSWQTWTKVPFTGPVEKSEWHYWYTEDWKEFTLLDGSGLVLRF